jgi:hypothetical protein
MQIVTILEGVKICPKLHDIIHGLHMVFFSPGFAENDYQGVKDHQLYSNFISLVKSTIKVKITLQSVTQL